ncbi:hypothetical protein ABTA35_19765, partial [Acinetobacter baumannii]
MSKKRPHDHTRHTNTTEFEVEGIEEAYAPAHRTSSGQPWKAPEPKKLEVERPPELQEEMEHTARIWILERRARGFIAKLRRWL